MKLLETILIISTLMWYIIDRLKPAWASFKWARYITMLFAAALAFALCFVYKLDLIYALGMTDTIGILGMILTALVFMGGSSAVAELIGKIKGG